MTKLAILADIHGNLPALEAVLADLAPLGVGQVIVAGDVINWGPHSAEVMARVVAAGWPVIRGNNEFYLLDYETPRAPAAWADRRHWSMLPWLQRQLAGQWQTVIAGWPDRLSLRFPDAPPVCVVHGSPRRNTEAMFPISSETELAAMLVGVEEQTVISAHTHLPLDRWVPGRPDGAAWHVLNPGSVGAPLDGEHCARYLLLEGDAQGWRGLPRAVPLDAAPILRDFEQQGFAQTCGVVGELVLREHAHARIELLPFLTWRQAHHPSQPLDADLLAEYDQVDPLPFVLPAYQPGWQRSRASGHLFNGPATGQ